MGAGSGDGDKGRCRKVCAYGLGVMFVVLGCDRMRKSVRSSVRFDRTVGSKTGQLGANPADIAYSRCKETEKRRTKRM